MQKSTGKKKTNIYMYMLKLMFCRIFFISYILRNNGISPWKVLLSGTPFPSLLSQGNCSPGNGMCPWVPLPFDVGIFIAVLAYSLPVCVGGGKGGGVGEAGGRESLAQAEPLQVQVQVMLKWGFSLTT